ncbi:hypothetical protein LTR37_019637 [Vermiconidia calcicola]|uniref:Uncharacterized protein n=1 Tax=Vermiconidia calcicola TaxID=1690605 RepID=A0ACC3MFG2_9PEZI|nr:hypothetical protein LTR37_019637 [Vermiconidia calcicola]
MDHPFIWAVVITSVWYEIIRIRRHHTIQAVSSALAAHCGIIVLLSGFTPSDTFHLTSKSITRLAQDFYRPLPDPLSPLGVFMLLLRWSDPQVFQGVLGRRWYILCTLASPRPNFEMGQMRVLTVIQLSCFPIIIIIRVSLMMWTIVLYEVGLAEIYDRPSVMLFHLVICLVSSLCTAELIKHHLAIYQVIAPSIPSAEGALAIDTQAVVQDAEPITPHAPGAFLRSADVSTEPEASESGVDQLAFNGLEAEGKPGVRSTGSIPAHVTRPQPASLKSALKKTNYPPLQIPYTLSVKEDEDGEFSVGPTSSPWPLPPIWAKLLSGYRSPGTVRMASPNWQAVQETRYEGSDRQRRAGGFSRSPDTSATPRPSKHSNSLRRPSPEAFPSSDPMQLAAMQELDVVECLLQAYRVECKAFREDSALAGTARIVEYNRLFGGLERHVMLDLDKFEANGDLAVQQRRRDLVELTQATLAAFNHAMQALPIRDPIYGADENMAQAAFKKQSRKFSLSPGDEAAPDSVHWAKHRKLDTAFSGGVRTPDRRDLKSSKRRPRRRIDLSDPDVDMDLMTPPSGATWAQSFSMPGLGWKDTPP